MSTRPTHTLRSGDEAEREVRLVREPVLQVHNDYTDWSGPQRLRQSPGAPPRQSIEARALAFF